MNAGAEAEVPWEPLPLWAPLSGRLFLGAVKTPVALLLIWFATLPPWMAAQPFSQLLAAIVVSTAATEIVSTLVDRIFVIRNEHDSPGGIPNTILGWVVVVVVAFRCGWLVLGTTASGVACATAFAITSGADIWIAKAWLPGDEREATHDKWERTKEMTRETFSDDVQEIKVEARARQRNNIQDD